MTAFYHVSEHMCGLNRGHIARKLTTGSTPLALGLHSQGFVVAGIFWGLWLLPLGALVIRSGFAPRVLGFLVILAGLAYLVDSFTSVLLPEYRPLVSIVALVFEAVGELSMIGWLLITGARAQPLDLLAA
jgi:hypothetical protein